MHKKTFSANVLPWQIKTLPFLLFIWTLFTLLEVTHYGTAFLLPHNTPYYTLLPGIFGQCSILFFFFLGKSFFSKQVPFPLNTKKYSLLQLLQKGFLYFLIGLPTVWIASQLWLFLLPLLLKLTDPLPLQQLVTLLQEAKSLPIWFLAFLLTTVLAPAAEELIFRASLYRFLKNHLSTRTAFFLSSLLFALIHFNLLCFFPLFVLSLLLTHSYEKTGHIGVPICFHAFFNLNTTLLLLLQTPASLS